MEKLRVGVFFGGKSTEHEVSIKSATSVVCNLDYSKYDVLLVGVSREGHFFFGERAIQWKLPSACGLLDELRRKGIKTVPSDADWVPEVMNEGIASVIDVAFPVFHGEFGEDGAIQGLFEYFGVPFVGASVLGSSIGIDKDVTKRLLRDACITTAKHMAFYRHENLDIEYEKISMHLGETLFVKPASRGSSIGVRKVHTKEAFDDAVINAFQYDNKIVVEEFVKGREVECSVLGNEYAEVSLPGEIVVNHEFYSYAAKYLDENAANLKIPADLPQNVMDNIRRIATQAYKVLCCEGMARVDFFVRDDGEVCLNEINTIPGFTREVSLYPKLWEATGLPYKDLLDRLIELALFRHKRENRLSHQYLGTVPSQEAVA
ncbi:MAG: D-alanine--D-alanine ligase [Holosporaceae bacterium]|jgi:D-alanine-D-alanine ligase|nr:D-alanine--D-alanine ligase [Holosporaceae bacterium]